MLKRIFFLGTIWRLVSAFWGQHSDIVNYYWWSKDLLLNGMNGFYDRNIVNAMRATYPPITSYIFWLNGVIHEMIWKILWFINLKVSFFPSNLIFWWESKLGWYYLNKLPAIIADVGIAYVLYKIVAYLRNKRLGILAAGLFMFLPPFWYSSAIWGQTDSLFILPMLLSIYFLIKGNHYGAIILYGISIFTKPTALFIAPVFLLWWLKGRSFKEILNSITILVVGMLLLYLPFHPNNTLSWVFQFYNLSLKGELFYINANAFNLWGLLYGFKEVSYKIQILQIPLYVWGYALYIMSLVLVVYKIISAKIINNNLWLLALTTSSFGAFMFLPAMHERYFYPTIVLFVILVMLYKELGRIFWPVIFIYFVNLYHLWWYPNVPILVNLFSNLYIEKLFIFINIYLYSYMFIFTLLHFRRSNGINFFEKLLGAIRDRHYR